MARTWTREHAINLQTLRKAQRWTLDQLARRANLEVSVVQELERATEMDVEDEEVLRRLAMTLGVLPKQLCNSPLKASKAGPVITTRHRTVPQASQPPAPPPATPVPDSATAAATPQRPGTWAVAIVAVTLMGVALMPRSCSAPASSATAHQPPRAASAIRSSKQIAAVPQSAAVAYLAADLAAGSPLPSAGVLKEALGQLPAGAGAETAQVLAGRPEPEARELLVGQLTTASPAGAAAAISGLMQQPPAVVGAALEEAAERAEPRLAERLIIVLVLQGDSRSVGQTLPRYLERLLRVHDHELPWPHPGVRAALALPKTPPSTALQEAAAAVLQDESRPASERDALAQLLAASGVMPESPDSATTGAQPEPASPASAPAEPLALGSVATDPPAAPSHEAVSPAAPPLATADAPVPTIGTLQRLMTPPVTDPAQVALILQQTTATLSQADPAMQAEVRQLQQSWLAQVPADWLIVTRANDSLWYRLGTLLFPDEAGRWETAFGTSEETWLILVVARLLSL